MKKTIIVLGCLSLSMVYAQSNPAAIKADRDHTYRVGVNTDAPQASMDIMEVLQGGNPIDSRIQGLSLPNFTTEQRSKFGEGQTESMKIGTLIYNTTKKCIEMYLGYYDGAHQWSCSCNLCGTEGQNTNKPSDASIAPTGFTGVYVAGANLDYSPYRYVKFKIKNNTLSPLSNLDFSRAVTLTNGGTVSVVPSQNANVTINGGGEVELTYRITGTLAEGVLKADFNGPAGLTATQQIEVPKATAKINDVIIETRSFDTTQGTMASRNISIPFTEGLGRYDSVDMSVTPLDGEGGDQNGMKLTIPAGSFSDYYATNGTINARLTVDGDNLYNIKKNAGGLRQDYATFRVTLGNTSFNVILRSIGGYEASIEQEASYNYTRNNCGSGFTGESVPYKRTATVRGVSWNTQEEADNNSKRLSLAEAQRLVYNSTEGTAYANANGRCISTGRATIADYTHTPILSFDVTQGELRDGLTLNIPYTNGTYGGYEAVNTSSVATAEGEGGDVNNVSVSIPKGTYNYGSGNIPVTIKVDGDQNYLVKKTEGDNNGYTIVTVPVTMSTGQTFNIILKAKGGWREEGSYTGTATFRKNDCGQGFKGSDISYTGTATAYGASSVSKAEAVRNGEANARVKFDEQGQEYANQNGTCERLNYSYSSTCSFNDSGAIGYNREVRGVRSNGDKVVIWTGSTAPSTSEILNYANQSGYSDLKALEVDYSYLHQDYRSVATGRWCRPPVATRLNNGQFGDVPSGCGSSHSECDNDFKRYAPGYSHCSQETEYRKVAEYQAKGTTTCNITQ